jgi:glycosyltransferase involved in cell wall biosynthesis
MPNFSVALIAKDEAKTLPCLMKSLEEFQQAGGEVVLLDTGSIDGTPGIAEALGCKVQRASTDFLTLYEQITVEDAKFINANFVAGGEEPIATAGSKVFSFSKARNLAAALASNPVVLMPDCDEVFTALDLDWLQEQVACGADRIYCDYVWSRDAAGHPQNRFLRDRMYDRQRLNWTGTTHEHLIGDIAKRVDAPVDRMAMDHRPPKRLFKSDDLLSMAYDMLHKPDDRRMHYFGRELMYRGRPQSAINLLEQHSVLPNAWITERAQSLIYVGDCWGRLGNPGKQAEAYFDAFRLEPIRRTALLRLANWHKQRDQYAATAAFASAALEIPYLNFYADTEEMYRDEPHALLYWAKGWQGDIAGARKHLLECLKWKPRDPVYLDHTKYYFEYKDQGIEGWMTLPELLWLYETAKKMERIAELGSWKGRSTLALLSGCKDGTVTAIDHFRGSVGEEAQAEGKASGDSVYKAFLKNTAGFANLLITRDSTVEAAAHYSDGYFDMVFIDAEHTYEGVKRDIQAWRKKARVLLCGHDYSWPQVKRAVDEELGAVQTLDTIWYKQMDGRG